jgi:hypothetical protein
MYKISGSITSWSLPTTTTAYEFSTSKSNKIEGKTWHKAQTSSLIGGMREGEMIFQMDGASLNFTGSISLD